MGEAKKRRHCPAVEREIASAECGENRLSRYACPESCPYNPFSAETYSTLLEIENRLDLAAIKRLVAEDPSAREAVVAGPLDSFHALNAASVWHLFFKRDAKERTFAERWEAGGFSGLRNDERVLFRGKMKLRVALIEVHRVIDAQRMEVVDLLDETPSPFVAVDRSLAARVPRFFTALAWIYPLPHFWRLSGSAIDIADIGPWSGQEMIDACVTHLGGPKEPAGRRRWLAENFLRMSDALTAVGHARRRIMFAEMDAAWGAATYLRRIPAARALQRLREDAAAVEEKVMAEERAQGFTHAFVWFDSSQEERSARAEPAGGRLILGRVLIGETEWRLEGLGQARLQTFRERFEKRMGDAVQFSREGVDNYAGQMAAKEPDADMALVPPRLLEQTERFTLSSSRSAAPADALGDRSKSSPLAEAIRVWRDSAVPMLDGRTPRDAARDPALRPKVIQLVKKQVRQIDRANLDRRGNEDANELIRDLGLTEIDFPPPPPREPIIDEETDEDGFEEAFDSAGIDDASRGSDRPRAPRMMEEPFAFETAVERLEAGLRSFNRAVDALAEIEASGATFLDDLAEMTEPFLRPKEFDFLTAFLIQAWFVFVPLGAQAPEINLEAMANDIDELNSRLAQGGPEAASLIEELPKMCRQPALLSALMGQALSSAESMPKKARPKPEGTIGALVVLKAFIDELDRALRVAPERP